MSHQQTNHAFAGKAVLITGSTSGIGKELAIQLGRCGARVVINGTSAEKLNHTVRELSGMGLSVVGILADVTNDEDCQKMADFVIDKFGRLDIVVANAGLSAKGTLQESDTSLFRRIFEVNVLGVVNTVKYCLPHLESSKGEILITGSAIGFGAMPSYSAYAASKMALTALQQSWDIELGAKGIRVAIAYVGITENDADKTLIAIDGSRTERINRGAGKGRVATQQEVAAQMLRMLEQRQSMRVFSALGKLNYWINRLAPSLARWMLSRHYRRSMQTSN